MFKSLANFFIGTKKEQKEPVYQGDYSFYICPKIEGDLPYHTCKLTIFCYSNIEKKESINFKCNWYRVQGNNTFPINNKDNMSAQLDRSIYVNKSNNVYSFTPYDLGFKIKVVVKSLNQFNPEIAEVTFPIVKYDPMLNPYLENSLISCQTDHPIKILSKNNKIGRAHV